MYGINKKQAQLILGKDRRQKVKDQDLKKFPYNCIGQIKIYLKNGTVVFGSGFLICSCLVVTAAHNLDGSSQKYDAQQFTDAQFILWDNFNGAPKPQLRHISFQDYMICSRYKFKDANSDYAVMKLAENIKRTKYFTLGPTNPNLKDMSTFPQYTVCGFQDNDSLMLHSNRPHSIVDSIMNYKIDTKPGQSGCPVYQKNDNSKVVAIHNGYMSAQNLNQAIMITNQVVSDIQRWAIQMGAHFKITNDRKFETVKESSIKRIQVNRESEHKIKELTEKLNIAYRDNLELEKRLKDKNLQNTKLQNQLNGLKNNERQRSQTILSELKSSKLSPVIKMRLSPKQQSNTIKIEEEGYYDIVKKLNQTPQKSKITTLILINKVICQLWKCTFNSDESRTNKIMKCISDQILGVAIV